MLRELGEDSWDGWMRFWTWWDETPLGGHDTKQKYVDDAQALLSWAAKQDRAVPNFKPNVKRPTLSPSRRRKAGVVDGVTVETYQFDHAFCDPTTAATVTSCRVVLDDVVRSVSDHAPLVVELGT